MVTKLKNIACQALERAEKLKQHVSQISVSNQNIGDTRKGKVSYIIFCVIII